MSMSEIKAVALKYPEGACAPFITATANGKLAEKLLEIAKDNSIPIVKDDILANVLTAGEIGSCVPEETWELVAKIFSFIVETDKRL